MVKLNDLNIRKIIGMPVGLQILKQSNGMITKWIQNHWCKGFGAQTLLVLVCL